MTKPPSDLFGSPGHGSGLPRVNHSALHMLETKSNALLPAGSAGRPTDAGSEVGTGVKVAVGTGVLVGESVGVVVGADGVSSGKPLPPPPRPRPNPIRQPV